MLLPALITAAQIDLVGPVGSGAFGNRVTLLPNGNFVVTDPLFDSPGGVAGVGAVTWRDGTGVSGAVVSVSNSLTGSVPNDSVGFRRSAALSNGHYVVRSPLWSNGAIVQPGAATWRNGSSGSGAVVSSSNSLVGATSGDRVGEEGVFALNNGHYVVDTARWDNGATVDAGALTWRNGSGSSNGVISASNSLVGSTANDRVGDSASSFAPVVAQSNGNYVVLNSRWNNAAIVDAGAISLGFGAGGTVGPITAVNSVRGTVTNDIDAVDTPTTLCARS